MIEKNKTLQYLVSLKEQSSGNYSIDTEVYRCFCTKLQTYNWISCSATWIMKQMLDLYLKNKNKKSLYRLDYWIPEGLAASQTLFEMSLRRKVLFNTFVLWSDVAHKCAITHSSHNSFYTIGCSNSILSQIWLLFSHKWGISLNKSYSPFWPRRHL